MGVRAGRTPFAGQEHAPIRYGQGVGAAGRWVVVPEAPDQPLTIVEFQFQRVFVSWLEQRFKDKTKKEIETMLLGELPDLEETASGKDLIRIGEQRGEKRGEQRGEKRAWEKAILTLLATRHGTVPAAIEEKIAKLTSAEAKRTMQFLAQCPSLDEVTEWQPTENQRPKTEDLAVCFRVRAQGLRGGATVAARCIDVAAGACARSSTGAEAVPAGGGKRECFRGL